MYYKIKIYSLNDVSPKVRVCHDDSDYYSYTEIPIECISQGLSYTLVPVGGLVYTVYYLTLRDI